MVTKRNTAESFSDGASADLASALPESLTIEVSLPSTVHSTPADELAVAIVEVPIDPGLVEVLQPSTTSIDVIAPVITTVAIDEPAPVVIPDLPGHNDQSATRRS